MRIAVTRQTNLDTLRHLQTAEPGMSAEAAHALWRLVLEFGGGPIVRTSKGAPLAHPAVAESSRRGFACRSADETRVTVDVAGIFGITDPPSSWQAGASDPGWVSEAVWASDAGIEAVAEAWRSHQDGRPS